MDDRAFPPQRQPKSQAETGLQSQPGLRPMPLLLALLLALGVLFRVAHLDQKVFWVDEVATVIRAAGYTKTEVIAQLATGRPHTPTELLAYKQITPERTLSATLSALVQSPEHTPLYFLLTRFWMQLFGSSIVAVRSFSVLCSLLVLPSLYWLCQALFRSKRIGWTAVMLMAISPFFVAYAQEARPYSLWLFTVVLCWGTLLRAMRLNSWESWAFYAGMLALSSYTSLLSVFLAMGQGLYVWGVERPFNFRCRSTFQQIFQQIFQQRIGRYGAALSAALLAFTPWIWVILHHRDALEANTTWMRTAIHPLAMVAIWLYSFAILFFDVPVVAQGWIAVLQAIVAAIVLVLLGHALFQLVHTPRRIWLLIATLCLPIPLALILIDLLFQGQASATSRYLIPAQLGVLISVAGYCSLPSQVEAAQLLSPQPSNPIHLAKPTNLANPTLTGCFSSLKRGIRSGTLAGLLSLSLLSGWINLNRSPDYQKARNRHNPAIAALLNQAPHPRLLAEPAQTMDLLSLSHSLDPTTQVQILPLDQLLPHLTTCPSVFLFNPSPALITAAQTAQLNLTPIYQPQLLTPEDVHLSLWRAYPSSCLIPPV